MIWRPSYRTLALWVALLTCDIGIQVVMKIAGDFLAPTPFGLPWIMAAFSSSFVWIALSGYLLTLILWLQIIRTTPLSVAFPITASTYAFVPLAGWALLGEHLTLGGFVGVSLILIGVLLQGGKK